MSWRTAMAYESCGCRYHIASGLVTHYCWRHAVEQAVRHLEAALKEENLPDGAATTLSEVVLALRTLIEEET